MPTTILSIGQFKQDLGRGKRAANDGPVIITDRGEPAYVLLKYDDYRRLAGVEPSIRDVLDQPGIEDIDFDLPRLGDAMFRLGMMELPEGWQSVGEDAGRLLLSELRSEIGRGHTLFGISGKIIARRIDADDVLLALGNGQVAEVHLTWSKAPENDPKWPQTKTFESVEMWTAVRVAASR